MVVVREMSKGVWRLGGRAVCVESPNMQSHGDVRIQKPRTVLSKKTGLVDRIMRHADYGVSVSASSILSILP